MLFGLPFAGIQAAESNLPPDVQATKLAYDTFESVIKKYESKIIQQVNDHEDLIQTINVGIEPFELEAGQTKEIELPADIVRIMFPFTRIDVLGSGFKSTEFIQGISAAKGNTGKVSSPWFSDTNYQIRTTTFTVDHVNELERGAEAYTGYKFKFTGPVKVDAVQLFSQHGVSMTMDTTAWEVLGADREILDGITVSVDGTNRLSIEGITSFENDKFKRVYAYPTGHDDGYKVAEYYTEKDFMPGRQIYKFGPALEIGYDAFAPKLKEDPQKPGYADYSIFPELFSDGSKEIATFDRLYPSDLEYVLCFNHWPSWYVDGADTGKGTPGVENFEAAADLAAKYIVAHDKEMEGRGPKWVEVKNEATITSNWTHHYNPIPDYGWDVLADFHNITADAIKKESPEILVGGATAAWMALDHGNFKEAERHLKFLDDTAEHLDFYSYHFYESKDLILNDTKTNYGGYLTGRFEADLDLLRNHMILTDNVKPFVISETGTLHSGPGAPDYWINLKNFNSYLIRYMNRANEFDIVVPFLIPATWWEKDSHNTLWAYDKSGRLVSTAQEGLTDMKYFIETWDEYNGDLLPVSTNDVNDNIFVHSAQDQNIIYVAVTNMNPQRAYIDLDLKLKDEEIEKIERTTSYLDMGEIHFVDNEQIDSLENIFMHVEETSIFKITLNKSPKIDNTVTKMTYYGDSMLHDTGANIDFAIKIPSTDVSSSVLRVSLGRTDGFSLPLNVTVNGYNFEEYDMSFSNKPDRYFGYVDFIVPVGILREENEITVSIEQSGGKISTVALINLEN